MDLMAFGSSLSGMVMSVDNLCSEHSLEHPLSANHHEIAHGAGLDGICSRLPVSGIGLGILYEA